MFKKFIPTCVFIFIFFGIQFQSKAQYLISHITIEGNVKTKSRIILRELPYQEGSTVTADSLPLLNTIAKQQLINTALFYDAQVTSQITDSQQVKVQIKVSERWYLFPLPYFRWVDRNFNEWWTTQKHSLDRVNYGISIRQSNATGNNDKLTVGFITGYTQQSVVKYQFPYLDKKMRFGMGLGWQNFTQKEMNTSTFRDKQVFTRTQAIIQKGYGANLSLLYRPNLYERHIFQFGVGQLNISDSAKLAQPFYLPNFGNTLSYFDASIAFTNVNFDYIPYPTKGNSNEFYVYHRFSGNNPLTSFQFRKIHVNRFYNNKAFYLLESNTQAKLLANSNYMDSKLLGYGNMQMNGLDFYVIDGNAASIFKAQLNYLLGSFTNPKHTGIGFVDKINKSLPELRFKFWLKAFTNLGYVYSERPLNASKLSNTLLKTAGIGIDIISIYDLVIKFDYSVNQLGDKGVYLRGGINF